MKLTAKIGFFLGEVLECIKRFPVTVLFSFLITLIMILLTDNHLRLTDDVLEEIGRFGAIFAFGIPISLFLALYFERKSDTLPMIKYGAYFLAFAVLALYYLFMLREFNMVTITRIVALNLSAYALALTVHYFFKREKFELYILQLVSRFFTTVLYSVVLFGGLSAILFTIDSLFAVNLQEGIYLDFWFVVVGVFAVILFLSGVPNYNKDFETDSFPKLIKALLLYIVMPLIVVYTAILYVYFARIILTWVWPAGIVAHLVLWYSVLSAVVLFLITPLNAENKWVKYFQYYLPKAIIPLLFVMFVSIGIRVEAFGVTENRYFAIVLGIFSLVTMIYLTIKGYKKNIVLPLVFASLAILSVVGPWSAYSVSIMSQNARFESILATHDMIRENEIVQNPGVSEEDKRNISSIISYFEQNHTLMDLRILPDTFATQNMTEVFGFAHMDIYGFRPDAELWVHIGLTQELFTKPINITGFDYMFTLTNQTEPVINQRLSIEFDEQKERLILRYDGASIYEKSILDIIKSISQKHEGNVLNLSLEQATFRDENEKVRVKMVIHSASMRTNEASGIKILEHVHFYLLTNIK